MLASFRMGMADRATRRRMADRAGPAQCSFEVQGEHAEFGPWLRGPWGNGSAHPPTGGTPAGLTGIDSRVRLIVCRMRTRSGC